MCISQRKKQMLIITLRTWWIDKKIPALSLNMLGLWPDFIKEMCAHTLLRFVWGQTTFWFMCSQTSYGNYQKFPVQPNICSICVRTLLWGGSAVVPSVVMQICLLKYFVLNKILTCLKTASGDLFIYFFLSPVFRNR